MLAALLCGMFLLPVRKAAAADEVRITGYEVVGARNISSEVVLLAVESKVGDVFSTDVLKKDVDALKRLGYFFYVTADTVPWKGGVKIVFHVYENPVVKGIRIEGNHLIPDEEIRKAFDIKTGLTLNVTELRKAIGRVNKLYQEKGWAFCGILSQDQIYIDRKTGELVVRIAEPVLRNVKVEGNTKTRNYVILREIELKRGEVVKNSRLKRSLKKIYNLKYFEEVSPPRPMVSKDLKYVDLIFQVKEQKTGQASFGGGYSSVNGMIGFLEVKDINFMGRGQTLSAKMQFGGEQRYMLDFYEPWFKGRPMSVGAGVFNMSYNREEVENRVIQSYFEERRSGYSLRTGWRIARDSKLSVRFVDETLHVSAQPIPGTSTVVLPSDLQPLDYDGDNAVVYDQQTLQLTLTRDTRDNVLDPSEGFRASFSVAATGDWLKGINGYYRYVVEWRNYRKLRRDRKTIFAYRLKYGWIDMTEGELRFVDRFTLGGAESLRGYEDQEFTGRKFVLGNFEVRFNLQKLFGLVLFYDIGDAYDVDETDDMDLKHSYGIGLRLRTPIGPFRFDYGKGEDRSGRFHFGIGEQF